MSGRAGEFVEPRDFLVRKGGYFYRPNAQGYTVNASEAGRFTFSQAWDYSHPNGEDGPRDGITFMHESEVHDPARAKDDEIERLRARNAELDATVRELTAT